VSYLRDCQAIARRLRARATQMGADRVVISTTVPASLYAIGALRWSQQSLWLDIDDWSSAQFVARGGSRPLGSVYDGLERTVPRLAHRVTACSNELAVLLPTATVVPNFIRLADVPARPDGATTHAPGGTRVRVTFASSVTPYYGHVPLLTALARRRPDCPGIEFRVVGDGVALDTCRQLVARAGLGDIVQFTGWLDRAAMLDELVRSDVSVLPLHDTRLDRARFPLKMLDALACGCALAASDTGMVRETLTDGKTALLSPPGDMDALVNSVLELVANPELRVSLSEAGRALVGDFDEDVVCGRWMTLLS
jgi:glycosyltransferase involved in cell wall biosynthesis